MNSKFKQILAKKEPKVTIVTISLIVIFNLLLKNFEIISEYKRFTILILIIIGLILVAFIVVPSKSKRIPDNTITLKNSNNTIIGNNNTVINGNGNSTIKREEND